MSEAEKYAASNTVEPQTRKHQCKCGATFSQELIPALDLWTPPVCESCLDSVAACNEELTTRSDRKAEAARREELIREVIPDLYRGLADAIFRGDRGVVEHERFPREAWCNRLATWEPVLAPTGESEFEIDRGKGLLLFGHSGFFKSTVACALLMRFHRTTGESIFYLPAADYGEAAQDKKAWSKEPSVRYRAMRSMERAKKARLTVIDDLGKQSYTANVDKAVKLLLEERTKHLLPTIITTQHSREELLAMFTSDSKETGEAIVRRITDYFTAVPCVASRSL